MITFDDFKKLDIRIGKVISCEKVPDTDKLLKFVFDLGNEEKQIISAIAEFIKDPSSLIGKEIPILINLEPRTFKGHESQGMILAADVDGKPIFLYPEEDVPPGTAVI